MKKALVFLMTLCLLFALTACSQGKQTEQTQDQTQEQTQDQAADQTQDQADDQTQDQTGDQAEDQAQDQTQDQADDSAETQTISGVVNRLDNYLVLMDGDGAYHIFDFGEDVDQSSLEEGDSVTVTYTGVLDSEDPAPVAIAIEVTK